MLGYTLDLINDINTTSLFASAFGVLSDVTNCPVELSVVCTTDEGDMFQVGELPFCTVTASVVVENGKNKLQVFVMPTSRSLAELEKAAEWVSFYQGKLTEAIQYYLSEEAGHECVQTA